MPSTRAAWAARTEGATRGYRRPGTGRGARVDDKDRQERLRRVPCFGQSPNSRQVAPRRSRMPSVTTERGAEPFLPGRLSLPRFARLRHAVAAVRSTGMRRRSCSARERGGLVRCSLASSRGSAVHSRAVLSCHRGPRSPDAVGDRSIRPRDTPPGGRVAHAVQRRSGARPAADDP